MKTSSEDYIVAVIADALMESIRLKEKERQRKENLSRDEAFWESVGDRFEIAMEIIRRNPELFEEYCNTCLRRDII